MKTCKVVLTGGPCGGKTESLDYLKQRLIKDGKSVIAIEETANSLLTLGYIPNINISAFDFQNLLFKIQFLKEYFNEGKADLILCDRGLLDGKAYMDYVDFEKILEQNNVDEQLILSTYDVALYFRSIAYDYPENFSLKRIYESPETGIFRDKRCKDVWDKKLISCNYNNLDGFVAKQEAIYLALIEQLDNIQNDNLYDLSDYYNDEYIKMLLNEIDLILQNCEISNDIKAKTRSLVK